jgi:Tfp pilus assembly protein PilN
VRPVNLIPPEERRGEKAPMRTGPLAYVVVGALAALLLAVTFVVLTSNQISDREAEKASLASQVAQAQAEAQRLQSFSDFATVKQAREETVSSLARSRFDWERVLRELAIVIPADVRVSNLTAGVSADSASGSSASSSSTSSTVDVQAPSLQIQGCASGHDAVAKFLAALRDIDGVTRASVLSSNRPTDSSAGDTAAAGSSAAAGTGSASCSAGGFVDQFELVAAFDAVQVDQGTGLPAPATPATTTPTSTTQTTAAGGSAP